MHLAGKKLQKEEAVTVNAQLV